MWTDLLVHRQDRRRHPGNGGGVPPSKTEEGWREKNKERGTMGTFDQERETRDRRRESESRERQEYTREKGGGDRVPTVRSLPVANI